MKILHDSMNILHDSRNRNHRQPRGAVSCGETVTLRAEARKAFYGKVLLRLWIGGEEMLIPMKRNREGLYEASAVMPEEPGLVWYYFIIQEGTRQSFLGNREDRLGGCGVLWEKDPPAFQITVSRDFSVPRWIRNRILYQIFPDSFRNGNPDGSVSGPKKGTYLQACWDNEPSYHKDREGRIVQWGFFGGNLKGITQKLDYLKSLGVGVLYLNPIFEAASPHRYNTGDYLKIDGMLGTMEDFETLVAEAKKRDIGILLDGVFSHTGADSRYFNKAGTYDSVGAFNSPDSPYYAWYRFKNYPDQYECWWGVDDLPNVDEMNESYRHFIYEGEDSVLRFWLRKGVMGFRLDVADELPDAFIKGLRQVMEEENPDAVLIGEVWEDASNKISYGERRAYFDGRELHSVMNYPFYKALLEFALGRTDGAGTARVLMSLYENYPREAVFSAMNLIGSHDRERILTLLQQESPPGADRQARRRLAADRLKLLVCIQMCLPGMPSIYYGDEAGMEGGADPANRAGFPWGREDPEILAWYRKMAAVRTEFLEKTLLELPEISGGNGGALLLAAFPDGTLLAVNGAETGSCRIQWRAPETPGCGPAGGGTPGSEDAGAGRESEASEIDAGPREPAAFIDRIGELAAVKNQKEGLWEAELPPLSAALFCPRGI